MQGTISANHQISHLEVIFVIIKFANHGMVLCDKIIVLIDISIISTGCVTLAIESEVDSFTVESVIRGYHIYEEVWSSIIGEVLACCQDTRGHHDPFAIATCS